jgi:hypothetical protein
MKRSKKIVLSVLGASMALITSIALVACGDKKAKLTWTGLEDVSIVLGDRYDVTTGITVTDSKLGDVTDQIVVLNEDEHEEILTDLGVWEDFEEFNYNIPGSYTVYYMVTSSNVTEIKDREVSVVKAHNLANGDFSITNKEGFTNWKLDQPGGQATLEKFTDSEGNVNPKFTIGDSGNAWYSLQYINNCNLKEGETYKITVRALSETGKSVAFGFEDVDHGYAMLKGVTVHKLTDSYQVYESYYTADSNYVNAKAVLYFGRMLSSDRGEHSVVIDYINIEKVEKCNEVTFTGLDRVSLGNGWSDFDAKAGVTAKRGDTDLTASIEVLGELSKTVLEGTNYELNYIVRNENGPDAIASRTVNVKPEKAHGYELMNGDFSEEYDYWTKDVNQTDGKGQVNWDIAEDGAAKMTIVEPSSAGWHIMLRQDVSLDGKTNYLISVTAKASINRSVVLEINGKTQFTMDLTTEYKTFEFAYTPESKIGGCRVSLLMGGGGSNNKGSIIYVKNMAVDLDPDQTQYESWQLVNSNFVNGMKSWGFEGTTFTEDKANGAVSTTFAEDTGANWNIQLRQDDRTVQAGQKYRVTIRMKSTVARKIKVEAFSMGDKSKLDASHEFDVTGDFATFTFEYTANKDANDVRIGILLGGSGIKDSTFTISQFEVTKVAE